MDGRTAMTELPVFVGNERHPTHCGEGATRALLLLSARAPTRSVGAAGTSLRLAAVSSVRWNRLQSGPGLALRIRRVQRQPARGTPDRCDAPHGRFPGRPRSIGATDASWPQAKYSQCRPGAIQRVPIRESLVRGMTLPPGCRRSACHGRGRRRSAMRVGGTAGQIGQKARAVASVASFLLVVSATTAPGSATPCKSNETKDCGFRPAGPADPDRRPRGRQPTAGSQARAGAEITAGATGFPLDGSRRPGGPAAVGAGVDPPNPTSPRAGSSRLAGQGFTAGTLRHCRTHRSRHIAVHKPRKGFPCGGSEPAERRGNCGATFVSLSPCN